MKSFKNAIHDEQTLDGIHKNYLKVFESSNTEELPRKKMLLKKYSKKLKDIDSKNPSEYTYKDIENKAKYKDFIENLENDIYDIENGILELDYYDGVGSVIQKYYDLQPTIEDNNVYTVNEIIENKKKYDESVNNKYTKKKKKKKIVRKKKKKNTNTNNIMEYFKQTTKNNSDTDTDENSNESSEENITKAYCLDQYKTILDSDYVPNSKKEYNPIRMCDDCNIEMTLVQSDGYFICESCSIIQYVIIDSEKPNYNENNLEKPGYPYKRMNHFNEWLSRSQGKDSTEIPEEIYMKIKKEFRKNKIYSFKNINRGDLRKVLKKLDLSKYYEYQIRILCKLSDKPLPKISRKNEDKLRSMFQEIQKPFEKHKHHKRQNFLSYEYILHKITQLLELDDISSLFGLLKNRDKLRNQDIVWKKICNELRWQFIPSV